MSVFTIARIGPIMVQVLLGLLLVWVVYRMSLWIMRKDQLVVDKKRTAAKEDIRIIDGFIDTPLVSARTFDTRNTQARNYIALPRSFNRRGGAQFTYYFWLYIGDASAENVRNRVIMLRGDPKAYTYTRTTGQADAVLNMPSKVDKFTGKPVVKCPAIGFGPTFDTFVVSFNTLDDPDETIVIKPNSTNTDVSARHNVLKLIRNKWALLSFVFEDNVAITDFEDGIIMRFYVNDVLYQVDKRRSTLRQNAGDLVLFPETSNVGDSGLKGSRIADLTYRNYAMSANSVREVYDAGPPKYFASELAGHNEVGDPLYLSVYNKLDIYNS